VEVEVLLSPAVERKSSGPLVTVPCWRWNVLVTDSQLVAGCGRVSFLGTQAIVRDSSRS
jgi:hypothetical protein